MLKIKKLIVCGLLTFALTGCGEKKEAKTKIQIQLDELDTLFLSNKTSKLEIHRFRYFNHAAEMLKVGKMGFRLTAQDLSINSFATYTIDTGYVIFNKKTFESRCFIKTSQLILPVIDNHKQLKIGTPGYLNSTTNYVIVDFKGSFFPLDRDPSATLFLTVGDSTGLVKEAITKIHLAHATKQKSIKLIDCKFTLNGLEWNLFEPENKTEIEKDSIQANLILNF